MSARPANKNIKEEKKTNQQRMEYVELLANNKMKLKEKSPNSIWKA